MSLSFPIWEIGDSTNLPGILGELEVESPALKSQSPEFKARLTWGLPPLQWAGEGAHPLLGSLPPYLSEACWPNTTPSSPLDLAGQAKAERIKDESWEGLEKQGQA